MAAAPLRPPSALSGADARRGSIVVGGVSTVAGARTATSSSSAALRAAPRRCGRRTTAARAAAADDDAAEGVPRPLPSCSDLFGADDPPPGPRAMASLLGALATASTAAELQAALLPFLPRSMLEDAEEQEGGEQGGEEDGPDAPDWGSQWRLAAEEQQQPPSSPQQPPPPPPPQLLPRALELMLRRPADEQPLDSFALRHLVLTRPRALEPLSALPASASRYVQRVAVLGATGERAVLTFTLARRGNSRSARRHAATSASGGAAAHWFLLRVEGEQGGGGDGNGGGAAARSSEAEAEAEALAPETVVARQLDALAAGDVERAYALASPVGRAVAGDLPRFRGLLGSDARFRPLLRHRGWASLRRTQSIARSYVEVVAVRPEASASASSAAAGEAVVYAVIASLHPCGGDDRGGGGKAGGERWLIDYFAPIRDPALLRALLTGAARPAAD